MTDSSLDALESPDLAGAPGPGDQLDPVPTDQVKSSGPEDGQQSTPDADTLSRDEQLRDLQTMTDAALSRLRADDLFVALLDRVVNIVDADTATILLHDEGTGMLVARASRGIAEEVRQGVRIPVGIGFAGRIAAERRPVMIDRVDPTTVANPILWERGIQVMLGVPLLSLGELIGVLHVGRCHARPFSTHDTEILSIAGERMAAAIQTEQRRQAQEATATLLGKFQPGPAPICAGFEFASRYLPAEDGGAGGDWYDLFLDEAGQLWIVIGDVAGHGLSAAVVMGRAQSTIRAYTAIEDDPAMVLERADRILRRFDPRVTATAICAVMPPPYEYLRLAVAGHPPPILATPDRPAELLATPVGPPLGFGVDTNRSSRTVHVPRGSTVVFYTDGLIERRGESIDDGLQRLCQGVRPESAEAVCRDLLRRHLGPEPLLDDAALLAVHSIPD
jgi:sigma-B regulation protein RsbU (phosphoserine phosphatase)